MKKMKQIYEFDCRTICDGKKCPHLHPTKDIRLATIIKIFICRDKNLIIHAETINKGNITEQISSICPIHSCCQMRKLQSEGLVQWSKYTINPDGTDKCWNPLIIS